MAAVEDEFGALVVDGGAQADDAGGAAGGEFVDFQGGVDGVAGVDGGEEAAGSFEEGFERVFDHMGEEAGAGGGLDGDLLAVGEQVGHAVAAAVLDVIVDGVVVAGDGLEGEEDGLGHGAAWEEEAFAYLEILESALGGDEAVGEGREGVGRAPAAAGGLLLLELVDEADKIEEAPLARVRMTAEATAMARWVLPVPVPPMKMALRLASRKAPVASSRTWSASTGVSTKTNVSRSLRTGNLAPPIR